jgi:hypothetical protein
MQAFLTIICYALVANARFDYRRTSLQFTGEYYHAFFSAALQPCFPALQRL